MRHPKDMSRRQFLTRAGGAAIAMPSLAAILAACTKPGATGSGGTDSALASIPIATLESPTELPMVQVSHPSRYADRVRPTDPLQLGRLHLQEGGQRLRGQVRRQRSSTFQNLEEGIQKVVNGQISPDVFVPTPGYLRRLVARDFLQPLQHELIPNMANVWQSYSNPGPYYDLNWHYSVPYTIYTWGVAYRRDKIVPGDEKASDQSIASQGWNALWNHDYAGEISLYDSYGDTIAITILRNGSLDVNSQRSGRHRGRKGSDPADDQRQPGPPHDQRGVRQAPGRRLRRRRILVRRHRRGVHLLSAGRGRPRYPRLLEARGRQDDDRERPPGDPERLEESAPRARVHQLHARREEGYRELHGVQRLSAPVHVDRPGNARRRKASFPRHLDLGRRDRGHVQEGPHAHTSCHPTSTRYGSTRGPRSRPVPKIATETTTPGDQQRKRTDRGGAGGAAAETAGSDERSGVWYPRWYWPSFIAPGTDLADLPVHPAVLRGVLGRVRHRRLQIFGTAGSRSTQPWWWSFHTFNATLQQFDAGSHIYSAPCSARSSTSIAASVICLVVGYAVAYYTARFAGKRKGLILILLVVAVLDQLPDADLRLAGPAAARRLHQRLPRPHRVRRTVELARPASRSRSILGLVYGYIPFMILPLFGVARPHRPEPARGGPRPRRQPVTDVPARDAPAVAARDPGRPRHRVAADVRRLLHEQPARLDQDVDVRQPDRRAVGQATARSDPSRVAGVDPGR